MTESKEQEKPTTFAEKAAVFKAAHGVDPNSDVGRAIQADEERKAAVAAGEDLPGKTAGELLKELERREATEEYGAPSRTPKADMLDARALEAKKPDKYLRYVSTRNEDKALQRKAEGFTPVDDGEAREVGVNARVGTSVLMEQDRRVHDARIKRQEKENDRRLRQHKGEVEAAIEKVAKEMRDRYGINIPVERLFVNE